MFTAILASVFPRSRVPYYNFAHCEEQWVSSWYSSTVTDSFHACTLDIAVPGIHSPWHMTKLYSNSLEIERTGPVKILNLRLLRLGFRVLRLLAETQRCRVDLGSAEALVEHHIERRRECFWQFSQERF